MADRTAAEVVPLHGALEALADRGPRDLDPLPRLEVLDGDDVADVALIALVAELDQGAQRPGIALLEMPELGLGEPGLAGLAEPELDRRVAVALGLALRGDRAGPSLDHRDRNARPVVGEDLGHAQLLADYASHVLP